MQSGWKNQTSETEGTAAFREEARKITEKITKTIKMSLYFEESGETLSVEISLENVSPCMKTNTIFSKKKQQVLGGGSKYSDE